jgi:hypothetical protein
VFDLSQASRILGVDPETLLEWISLAKVPSIKLGDWYVSKTWCLCMLDLIRRHRLEGEPQTKLCRLAQQAAFKAVALAKQATELEAMRTREGCLTSQNEGLL